MCELRQSQRDYCKSLLERVCVWLNVKKYPCVIRGDPSRIIAGHCLNVYVCPEMLRNVCVS